MEKKKSFVSEFKEFISRGSVIDMAVGVIIGGAFTAIVNSLVNDVIMPAVGLLVGNVDFTSLRYVITPAVGETAEVAIYYGKFIQNIINFLLIALVIFCIVKQINKFRRKKEEEPAPAEPTEDILLLREIRDVLKQKEK